MGARTLLQKSNERIDKVMEEKAQVPALALAHAHILLRARARTNACCAGLAALLVALNSVH